MDASTFSWSEFFHMGGYAFFVWWSYAIFFALIIANIVYPVVQRRQVIARVKRALRRESIGSADTAPETDR